MRQVWARKVLGQVGFSMFAGAISIAGAAQPSVVEKNLSDLVWEQIGGNDHRFVGWVAPGQYGTTGRTSVDQNVTEAIQKITSEVAQVYEAFAAAPNGQRQQATLAALSRINAQTGRELATRLFPATQPPASWMRQIAFVPVAHLEGSPAQQVFSEVTAFELLPKPDDTYFIYREAFNLRAGVREAKGTRNSHLASASSLVVDEPMAVKKCRHVFLLGWYCNTNHYLASTLDLPGGEFRDSAHVMVTTLVDLDRNSDDPQFASGARNRNTAKGYTALTLVARAGDTVLVYFSGIQHSDSIPNIGGFREKLDQGHKIEASQLNDRLRQQFRLR